MPKAKRKEQTQHPTASVRTQIKGLHDLHPWTCEQLENRCLIKAYVMMKGEIVTIAEVKAAPYLDAVQTADYIIKAANDYVPNKKLLEEAKDALELCLETDTLTWEAEQEAEGVVRKIDGK